MQTINFKYTTILPGDSIVDIGCGEGRHTIGAHFHFPKNIVIGIDLNIEDLKTAKHRLKQWQKNTLQTHPKNDDVNHSTAMFIRSNGFTLPFRDNSIDHVICSEVLEHIQDYSGFFDEINRVVKNDGFVYLSVPKAWPEKICWALSEEYHNVEGGHVHIFKQQDIEQLLKENNFQLLNTHGAHALHVPYWWLRCLFWKRGENFWPIKKYHAFLVWDLLKQPKLTQLLDKMLNPFMGKSVVFYSKKTVSKK